MIFTLWIGYRISGRQCLRLAICSGGNRSAKMKRSEMFSATYTSLSLDTELNYEITFNTYTKNPHLPAGRQVA